jgi:uracil-DNA glycosylase family 4
MEPILTQQLADAHHAIVSCERCPRLRTYCNRVASEKKRAYRDEIYWGRPVPGFGDPNARLLLVGLAPAAHGANRTGRVFTGDGTGGSGDFLMSALHRTGFANMTTSSRADDGLRLTDAYIAAAVRCAPPDNKPLPEEITRCLDHLEAEVSALPNVRVVVALGKIAFDAWLQLLRRQGFSRSASAGSDLRRDLPYTLRPQFGHGVVVKFEGPRSPSERPTRRVGLDRSMTNHQLPTLIGCYHPSRQNTNTGKLTAAMMVSVFRKATRML